MLFALSLGVIMALFEKQPEVITGPMTRKALNWLQSNQFRDPVQAAAAPARNVA
jgi:hypothetical protein